MFDLDKYGRYKVTKGCQVLLGIASGLLADGELNAEEVRFLSAWLRDNPEVSEFFPGNILAHRVSVALEDGRLTREEIDYLKNTLVELVGGTMQESGEVGGWSTTLPIQADAVVEFPGRNFCFTGEFIYGPRQACADITTRHGGIVKTAVSPKLDFLVIGGMASQHWANTSYGRKIEKAVEIQAAGVSVAIVSEEMWILATAKSGD